MKQVVSLLLLIMLAAAIAAGTAWYFNNNTAVKSAFTAPSYSESVPTPNKDSLPKSVPVAVASPAATPERTEAQIATFVLKEKGLDVSRETFVQACSRADYSTLDLLEKTGFDMKGENASAGLAASLQAGRIPLVRRFLEAGTSLPEIDGKSALTWALLHRAEDTDLLETLLKSETTPDSTALLAALEVKNQAAVEALLERGTSPDTLNEDGRTPLMDAAGQGWTELVKALLAAKCNVALESKGGWTACNYALSAGHPEIAALILASLPGKVQWNDASRQQFGEALANHNMPTVGVLFRYFSPEPVVDSSVEPLLIWAIMWRRPALVETLLQAGADPNTVVVTPSDATFSKQLPEGNFLHYYFESEKGMTALMLAAGLGETEIMRSLINKGARPNALTKRYKLDSLSFAARGNYVKPMQLLLGISPDESDKMHIEVSLGNQKVRLLKSGKIEYETKCSTGRAGYSTPTGEFVITDKHRTRVSNLYDAEMPYFMRLSSSAVGMHQGIVPNFPASHGCIRLPQEAARRLFSEVPVGTLVVINQ